jgi:hypothetical protein
VEDFMSATITGISRTGDVEPLLLVPDHQYCSWIKWPPAGGLLVDENCMDIRKNLNRFLEMRYVECGDMIDEIFPGNRCAPPTRNEKGE